MRQVAIMKYRVYKENHDKVMQVSRDYLDYEAAHPEIFKYNKTRYFYRDHPEFNDQEEWMFIDYFDDYNEFIASLDGAQENDTQAQAFAKAFLDNIIPGSLDKESRELWTEAESLRVDF